MRLVWLVLLLLAFPGLASAAGNVIVKSYIGTSTRDPLLGPHPLCDVAGQNVGGACFDIPEGASSIYLAIDETVSLGRQIVVISFYNSELPVGLPIDGVTYCAGDRETLSFRSRGADRIVLSIAPADITSRDCTAGPGTSGTITFQTR